MVASSIPIHASSASTCAQSRAGGWIASFDFDLSTTSTPPLPAIASTNESLDDSSTTTSTLTGLFCFNQQYSVTAITTSTGAVAERYAYTAYGQPTILNASGTPLSPQTSTLNSRCSHTGREWDETLGLHHFRARWMGPSAGRFLGRDPIGFVGSPWNLYEFFEQTPLRQLDPLGFACTPRLLNPNQRNGTYLVESDRLQSRWRQSGFSDLFLLGRNLLWGYANDSSASFYAHGALEFRDYAFGFWLIESHDFEAEAEASCAVRCSQNPITKTCSIAIECNGGPTTGIYKAFDQDKGRRILGDMSAVAAVSWDIWYNGPVGGVNSNIQAGAVFASPQIEINVGVGGGGANAGGTLIIPPEDHTLPSPFSINATPQWECVCDKPTNGTY